MPVLGDNSSGVDVVVRNTAEGTGIAETTAGLQDMSVKAKAAADSASTSFDNFNKKIGAVGDTATKTGKSMTEFLSVPLAGIAAESIKMATTFQQQMEMLHTNAGTAQSDIAGLSDAVLKLAPEVGASPEALATAFYHIASAGNGLWSTAQQLNVLKIAAEGAAVGQASLDDTTYSLTSALASNVKGASDAGQMMGVLTAIVGSGDMKMQDLNAAIGTGFLGTAATFGISIQSVGAALATLTDNGEGADAAATRLRMTWALMTSPSKQASGLLSDLGLSAEEAGTATESMNTVFAKTGLSTTKLADDLRQPNGMTVALRDLQTHLEAAGLSASETDALLSKTFGGGRTDAALLTMLQNLDRMDEKYQIINAQTGNFGANFAAQQETAAQKFKDAEAQMQSSLISLGQVITPAATKFLGELSHDVKDVSDWFSKLNGSQQDFVIKIAAAAVAVGPALLIFGKMASSLSAVGGLLSTVSKGMGLVGAASKDMGAASGIAGIAGDAGVAGEALGSAGLLSFLGPVALGLGAVAAGAGVAYVAVKHFNDMSTDTANGVKDYVTPGLEQYTNLAKETGVTVTSTASSVSLLTLANTHVSDSHKMVTAAATQAKTATDTYKTSSQELKDKQTDLKQAQDLVTWNLNEFGQDSPRYQTAVANLAQKQQDYDIQLQATANDSLNAYIKGGILSDAQANWKNSTKNLGDMQKYFNDQMSTSIGIVDNFAIDVPNKLTVVDTLHDHIGTVAKAWSDLNVNIISQNTLDTQIFQGMGSTLDKVQGQTITLNQSLAAASSSALTLGSNYGTLQGAGATGGSLKVAGARAGGGPVAAGLLYQVNEKGPEYFVPKVDGQIIPADKTTQLSNSSNGNTNSGSKQITVHIQQLILSNPATSGAFLDSLDQDNLLLSRGMAPNRSNQ